VPTKTRKFIDLKSLARGYTQVAIRTLGGIAKDGTSEASRCTAAAMLLDRGWGKPIQQHTHGGGAEGDGPIVVHVIHRERKK
jgi:hypothetical protein